MSAASAKFDDWYWNREMSESALSPEQAAAIASGVYAMQERSIERIRERNAPVSSYDPLPSDDSGFSGSTGQRSEGRSGNVFWHELSGFGYVAQGTGRRAGELLLATRGTESTAVALTDLNFRFTSGE
ncbi:MAG: hypothetical protein ACK53Z_09360 [Betaproteobacteria bacterium]